MGLTNLCVLHGSMCEKHKYKKYIPRLEIQRYTYGKYYRAKSEPQNKNLARLLPASRRKGNPNWHDHDENIWREKKLCAMTILKQTSHSRQQ